MKSKLLFLFALTLLFTGSFWAVSTADAGPDEWLVPWEFSIRIHGRTYENHGTFGADGEKFAVDFACHVGCKIYAPASGTLFMYNCREGSISHDWMSGYGNYIMYQPDDYDAFIILAHLESLSRDLVSRFKRGVYSIKKGEYIGYMGNTGNSTGTHLHFEITVPKDDIKSVFGYDVKTLMGESIAGDIRPKRKK